MFSKIAQDYPVIHLTLGLIGNLAFLIGSVLFFKAFNSYYDLAVWLFIGGSALMLIGSIGAAIKTMADDRKHRRN